MEERGGNNLVQDNDARAACVRGTAATVVRIPVDLRRAPPFPSPRREREKERMSEPIASHWFRAALLAVSVASLGLAVSISATGSSSRT